MKNTLVIDLDRCSGCDSCVAACKMENQMNLGVVRNHVSAVGPVGTFPDIEMYWLPMQCQQCENPGCIEVCPTGASYRDEETGIVLVNAEDCIGCESCLTGCPYGVRQLNPKTNTIEKCTLCFQRKNDVNWVPACVHNCCCGARTFGDLDDPNSEAAKVVAALEAGDDAEALRQVRVSRAFLADHILSWFDTFQDLALLLLETRFYRGILKISKGFFLEDAELLDAIAVELEQRLEAREER